MDKQFYITEEEREKCCRVIDAFAELYEIEDEDMIVVDVGRYGVEQLDTYTDNRSLFEGLQKEWFNLNLFLIVREMQLKDIFDEEVFDILSKEKQSAIIGRKTDFTNKADITL